MSQHVAFVPTALTSLRSPTLRTTSTLPTSSFSPPSTANFPVTSPLRRAHIATTPPSAPSPAAKPSRILLWFHTDLRVTDNNALLTAARAAAVPGACLVPVAAGAALDSAAAPLLAELKLSLDRLGSGILAVPGSVPHALINVCKKLNLNAVYFNRSILPARVAVEKRVIDALTDAGIAVEAFWGNTLQSHTPAASASSGPARSGNEGENALTALSARLSASVASPDSAPERLPALPTAASTLRGQRPIQAKAGGGTTRALKILSGMEKRTETLTLDKNPDLAVLLKNFLDYGALSPRIVAQTCLQVVGKWNGRTFSELVWREYMCLAAHRGAGVAVRKKELAV